MTGDTQVPGKRRLPELLAPAGSKEAFAAAIAAGADAVYLSGRKFGARKFAQNFSEEEIAEAIAYAHARGVRVYVTVNTLIHDSELPEALAYMVRLYAAGVDAVLVQDIGLAALAKEIVPGLVLHASTQLTIHNAEGERWAHEAGFARVVLARELPLTEVEAIAQATADTRVGLEVFAHGALCYSYSGQCLLSSVIGGRSGNRGMCAQPCRKPYALVAAKTTDRYGRPADPRELPVPGPYLLSPKDLCTYRDIPRLVDSPVAALKIEGRMKSPEYVAIVVSMYRRALDAAAAGTFVPDEGEVRDLALAFNRGFTRGYLFGDKKEKLMARDRPDNRGVRIGTVTRYNRTKGVAIIRPDQPVTLRPGDGLLFTPPGRPDKEWGFSLNTEPAIRQEGTEVLVPRPAEKGDRVFLTSSMDLAARARQIIRQVDPTLRHPVPVDLAATVSPKGELILAGTLYPPGKEPVVMDATGGFLLEPAKTRPLTREQLAAQLEKTGGTPFAVTSLSLDYDSTRFAPVGEINRVRREFFTRAEATLVASSLPAHDEVEAARTRLSAYNSREHHLLPKIPHQNTGIILWADSRKTVEAGIRAGAEAVCYEPCQDPAGKDPVTAIGPALEFCRAYTSRLIWKLPRITREEEIARVRLALPRLYAAGLAACMVDNPGAARAVAEAEPGMELAGSVGLNVFNAETVRALGRLPFTLLTLSPELSSREIADLARAVQTQEQGVALAVFAQGSLETMVTGDCLLAPADRCSNGHGRCSGGTWYGIRDGTGHLLPVRTDGTCQGHIFNSAETCLVDAVPDLVRNGIDGLIIDARGRTPAYAEEMVRIYREALGLAAHGTGNSRSGYAALKERAREISLGGITAGHYTRGLAEE
ncbi:U32 family peptidase [Methanoregula sp.]|uniref:U32 family peptidase n=1 Tax=Methanoregula sp. TaxID=2052170 RepID=UPI002C604155|nr:U32 family peptidase [Methanoregula sp.]HVP95918.1 U32 family peptidase [Methanoregula sp.]